MDRSRSLFRLENQSPLPSLTALGRCFCWTGLSRDAPVLGGHEGQFGIIARAAVDFPLAGCQKYRIAIAVLSDIEPVYGRKFFELRLIPHLDPPRGDVLGGLDPDRHVIFCLRARR